MRDEGLARSAVDQPQYDYHYGRADLFGTAAAYAFHIAQAQAFIDGSKRTGLSATRTSLDDGATWPHAREINRRSRVGMALRAVRGERSEAAGGRRAASAAPSIVRLGQREEASVEVRRRRPARLWSRAQMMRPSGQTVTLARGRKSDSPTARGRPVSVLNIATAGAESAPCPTSGKRGARQRANNHCFVVAPRS